MSKLYGALDSAGLPPKVLNYLNGVVALAATWVKLVADAEEKYRDREVKRKVFQSLVRRSERFLQEVCLAGLRHEMDMAGMPSAARREHLWLVIAVFQQDDDLVNKDDIISAVADRSSLGGYGDYNVLFSENDHETASA